MLFHLFSCASHPLCFMSFLFFSLLSFLLFHFTYISCSLDCIVIWRVSHVFFLLLQVVQQFPFSFEFNELLLEVSTVRSQVFVCLSVFVLVSISKSTNSTHSTSLVESAVLNTRQKNGKISCRLVPVANSFPGLWELQLSDALWPGYQLSRLRNCILRNCA